MRLKICDIYVTCKVANKCLNVGERLEVVEWKKRWFLPFRCFPVSRQYPWKKTLIEKKKIRNKTNKKYLPKKLQLLLISWYENFLHSLGLQFSTQFPHSLGRFARNYGKTGYDTKWIWYTIIHSYIVNYAVALRCKGLKKSFFKTSY